MLGNKVRAYRKLKGLSQEELADMTFFSKAQIGHIENGVRSGEKLDTLISLTKALDFSILIQKGNIYIEEDFIMKKKNHEVNASIMDKYSEVYKKTIGSYLYGFNKETNDSQNKIIDNIFDKLKYSDAVNTIVGEKMIAIEVAAYVDKEKSLYLLDFRGFEDIGDTMIDAYLAVYNTSDLEELDEFIDDVWTYANWVLVSE